MFFPPVPADLHLKQNAYVFIHGEHSSAFAIEPVMYQRGF